MRPSYTHKDCKQHQSRGTTTLHIEERHRTGPSGVNQLSSPGGSCSSEQQHMHAHTLHSNFRQRLLPPNTAQPCGYPPAFWEASVATSGPELCPYPTHPSSPLTVSQPAKDRARLQLHSVAHRESPWSRWIVATVCALRWVHKYHTRSSSSCVSYTSFTWSLSPTKVEVLGQHLHIPWVLESLCKP